MSNPRDPSSTAGAPDDRGFALLTVLVMALLIEAALLGLVAEVRASRHALRLELGRTVGTRLAESGIARARARLDADPWLTGTVTGELAEGTFEVEVERRAQGGHRLTAVGRRRDGQAVEIVVELSPRGRPRELSRRFLVR